MKKGIHPQTYTDTKVTCACGNSFVTQSTAKEIAVEICSACHPFYTGTQKLIDVEGRIEKFQKKMKATAAKQTKPKKTPKKPERQRTQSNLEKKRTLKDLLSEDRRAKERV